MDAILDNSRTLSLEHLTVRTAFSGMVSESPGLLRVGRMVDRPVGRKPPAVRNPVDDGAKCSIFNDVPRSHP